MLILGVPITDTVYAMIRRKFNKQKISSADKMHLHHRLLSLGFTHRGTVLTIYALAMVFSFIALLMNYASNTAIILLIISTGFGIELIGLVGENRQPLMCALKFLGNRRFRQKVLMARAEKRQDKQEEESEDLASSASQIKEKRRKRKHYQAKHKK